MSLYRFKYTKSGDEFLIRADSFIEATERIDDEELISYVGIQEEFPPRYVAVKEGSIIRQFTNAVDMDDFSRECNDAKVFIYRIGTDFLKDGHTEGYSQKIRSE